MPRARRLRLPARTAGRGGRRQIGVRPTFDTGRGELIEAYMLDFDGDLYGQTLTLEFLERLRGERRFDSARRSWSRCAPTSRARARSPRAAA